MRGLRRAGGPVAARVAVLRDLVIAAMAVRPASALLPASTRLPASALRPALATASRGDGLAIPTKASAALSGTAALGDVSSTPPDGPSTAVDDSHAEVWDLVTAAQQGDGEAFGRLYDRYVDTVFRYIYYRVNDRATAEDFTSETFLRALRRITAISYQGRDIGAWFITIARNIVLDHVKSARHRLETTTADVIEPDDPEPGPEVAVLSSLTATHLMRAVDRLGADQRECIMLRFIHGLSVSETAEVMGKNDGAVKALQHRAIRKLADLVERDMR